jgi:radical SAM protein with 4Fe4S-binding SPASM domain
MRQFKKIYIEITNVCNLSCPFCPKTQRSPEFMTPAMFAHILQKVHCAGGYLYFHVMGEPLLHPEIAVFLDAAHKAGKQVTITTNGTILYEKADELLGKPALRQVNISLHSIQGSPDEQEAYLNGILAFADAARSVEKPYVCLRLWNEGTADSHHSNALLFQKIERHFDVAGTLENAFDRQSNCTVVPGIFLSRAQSFAWPSMQCEDTGENGFCYGLRDQIAILVDGTVVPCCLDAEGVMALGNIMNQSLDEILNSTRAVNMYNGFSQRKAVEPLCRRCGYRTRFNKPE